MTEDERSKASNARRTASAQEFYDSSLRLDEELTSVHAEVLHCKSVVAAAQQVGSRRAADDAEDEAALAAVRKKAQEQAAKMRADTPAVSAVSAKTQVALMTTALELLEKDEQIAKLEGELEKYLVKQVCGIGIGVGI